jgi:hypothetical protein
MNQGAISADGWMRSYLPNVVAAYIVEIEGSTEQSTTARGANSSRHFSNEAAWELSRRGPAAER